MASQSLLSSFTMIHPLQERWIVEPAPPAESVCWDSLNVLFAPHGLLRRCASLNAHLNDGKIIKDFT